MVRCVQDTTPLNYTEHAKTQGMGLIGTRSSGSQGYFCHTTIALNEEGEMLGVLQARNYSRGSGYRTVASSRMCHQGSRNPSKKPPKLGVAFLEIAKLGGFLGRKSDGSPGPRVIWRGLRRLDALTPSPTAGLLLANDLWAKIRSVMVALFADKHLSSKAPRSTALENFPMRIRSNPFQLGDSPG